VWYYTSDSTGYTYAFGNRLGGQVAAANWCNDVGGHLVTWSSRMEQSEVERWVAGWYDINLLLLQPLVGGWVLWGQQKGQLLALHLEVVACSEACPGGCNARS
jgi:hypothetical protein